MLNEFFIYRKEFVRELKRRNLHPKQTKVSTLASISWHKQLPSVKDEYRRLARETERLFMIERQREASKTESNESSTDDSTSPTVPTFNNNYQISLPQNNILQNQIYDRTLPYNMHNYDYWHYNQMNQFHFNQYLSTPNYNFETFVPSQNLNLPSFQENNYLATNYSR
ncbi:hypothetical protein C1645_747073 [Glomus cerebriforme]|uniref:HMG box domain-containing protein n=1 Tax=Glomus cerebriforme TaxID=658196 RepID=A0A397TMW6_9GLOM|nr:hypothetical protein C1645_747073 [Glomus cerebriforme]